MVLKVRRQTQVLPLDVPAFEYLRIVFLQNTFNCPPTHQVLSIKDLFLFLEDLFLEDPSLEVSDYQPKANPLTIKR